MPLWLKRPVPKSGRKPCVEKHLRNFSLNTVCDEARCPNRGECFSRGTAAFLIMGEHCTRNCAFCCIKHDTPQQIDEFEPEHIARTAAELELSWVVVTSVTRDDLPDGGAGHFAETVRALRLKVPMAGVELLVPDFRGFTEPLQTVIESCPDVLNHNIETVPRLYPQIRPDADYERSLDLITRTLEFRNNRRIVTKSGLMVGLGETDKEVESVLGDLRDSGCETVTIGQYLRPSGNQAPVHRYVEPERFAYFEKIGYALGFERVYSAPFVRSSYRADEFYKKPSGNPMLSGNSAAKPWG